MNNPQNSKKEPKQTDFVWTLHIIIYFQKYDQPGRYLTSIKFLKKSKDIEKKNQNWLQQRKGLGFVNKKTTHHFEALVRRTKRSMKLSLIQLALSDI